MYAYVYTCEMGALHIHLHMCTHCEMNVVHIDVHLCTQLACNTKSGIKECVVTLLWVLPEPGQRCLHISAVLLSLPVDWNPWTSGAGCQTLGDCAVVVAAAVGLLVYCCPVLDLSSMTQHVTYQYSMSVLYVSILCWYSMSVLYVKPTIDMQWVKTPCTRS